MYGANNHICFSALCTKEFIVSSSIPNHLLWVEQNVYFPGVTAFFQILYTKTCWGYNAQHCLITLIEKWKTTVDNWSAFGALLTDLSKTFNCLFHELLIAKLYSYDFDKSSLKFINSYLSNRKQRVKINDGYSLWRKILFEVPQGSISGPLLFNIFICNMFYFLEYFDIANYADDTTPYCAGKSGEFVDNNLELSLTFLFEWRNNNYMKVNGVTITTWKWMA